MERVKTGIKVASGVVGSRVASSFGGWDKGIQVLLIAMAIDYITGLIVAMVFQKSTKTESGAAKSLECWKGLCRKGMTLLIVLMSYQLDVVAGTNFIRTGVIFAYIANESLSIVENAGQMGLDMPPALKKGIDILRDKDENNK